MFDPKMINQLRIRLRRDSDIGPHGILDSQASRLYEEDEDKEYKDIRPPFFRDVDRIVHSKAYARYIDKTQVFFEIHNANITHRSLHVILVSRIARQIGRVLKLNNDLIEAIALGHDVGHSPFGHLGERILDDISKKYGLKSYNHNAQSIRWLSQLERRFPKEPAKGLNLTLQVLDGILCHDGEINEQELKPLKINGKTWDDHIKEYNDCFDKNELKRIPMSYEGISVRFADTISYIGRDIEDAILLNFISRDDLPNTCSKILGDTNRTIMNTLIMDLLSFSFDNDTIGYSEPIFAALKELKTFNYNQIYNRRDLFITHKNSNTTYLDELRKKFEIIFKQSLKDLKEENYEAPIFRDHVEYIDNDNYSTYFKPIKKKENLALIVRDYVAGMSDKYFNKIYYSFSREKLK